MFIYTQTGMHRRAAEENKRSPSWYQADKAERLGESVQRENSRQPPKGATFSNERFHLLDTNEYVN